MNLRKILLSGLAILVVACGDGKKDSSPVHAQPNSAGPQKQSYIVRMNKQTGQAEYAPANFPSGNNPNRRQMMLAASQVQGWQPVDQNQTINQQSGFPQAND